MTASHGHRPGRGWRSLVGIGCGFVLVLAAPGCRPPEDITRTTEPHVEFRKPGPPTRILGAIAPAREGQSWFFKLTGPPEAVGKQEQAFDEFLESLKFDDGAAKPVGWVLPEGWREGPPRKGRYATILIGTGEQALELTVLLLGGSKLDNINRWRGQVGLRSVEDEKDFGDSVREVTTKQGRTITRVDLTGFAVDGGMPPFAKKK